MSRRKLFAIAILIVIALGFVPFESTLVEPWEIQFVDPEGLPISNVSGAIACYHYTYFESDLCSDESDRSQETGKDGKITFSRKSFRLSLMSRIGRSLLAYPLVLAHGSVGRKVYLLISVPTKYESVSLIYYENGGALRVVLQNRDIPGK